jgi:hypothetical protein
MSRVLLPMLTCYAYNIYILFNCVGGISVVLVVCVVFVRLLVDVVGCCLFKIHSNIVLPSTSVS